MRLWLVCWRLMEAGLPILCQSVIDAKPADPAS
jgi:hypothetical protein